MDCGGEPVKDWSLLDNKSCSANQTDEAGSPAHLGSGRKSPQTLHSVDRPPTQVCGLQISRHISYTESFIFMFHIERPGLA